MLSASAYLWLPSFVTLPVSTSQRRLVPSEPMTRSLSATGLKSTVAVTPAGNVCSSLTFMVALPVLASIV
jgi:hypothetical protein